MNQHTQHLLSELEGLISFEIKLATHHDLPEIRITTARAKDLLAKIRVSIADKPEPKDPAYFRRLDRIAA